MSIGSVVHAAPGPDPSRRGFVRWICTKNPFYVLSAGLFLIGLYISFGAQNDDLDTWAIMTGLTGYTVLLALTACLLVRFGHVWDDVRTVLLLIVLMFLATSVTFDEVLVLDPARGQNCCLVGLAMAIAVSEGLFQGIRLRLRAWFRGPYYLILGLFFLFPLGLSRLLAEPHSENVLWMLFGFSSAAGVAFLTLLPAIHRGPEYVRDNGSPWPWPLYPWSLFFFLAIAVPLRAYSLCWSMHLTEAGDFNQLIFGPYFLVPFGLSLSILLLEIGMVSRMPKTIATALLAPFGLVILSSLGHRDEAVYRDFLSLFTERLGSAPLFLTVCAAVLFHMYAAMRRTPGALDTLTASIGLLAFVPMEALTLRELVEPRAWLLVTAGAIQLALGVRSRASWRCLIGAEALALTTLTFSVDTVIDPIRGIAAVHLCLLVMLLIGALFEDRFAHLLRNLGTYLVLVACMVAMAGNLEQQFDLPAWAVIVYPLLMSLIVAGYGLWLRQWMCAVLVGVILACWTTAFAWRGYLALKQVVRGLDFIMLSLAILALAVVVSLVKSRDLTRRRNGAAS